MWLGDNNLHELIEAQQSRFIIVVLRNHIYDRLLRGLKPLLLQHLPYIVGTQHALSLDIPTVKNFLYLSNVAFLDFLSCIFGGVELFDHVVLAHDLGLAPCLRNSFLRF